MVIGKSWRFEAKVTMKSLKMQDTKWVLKSKKKKNRQGKMLV